MENDIWLGLKNWIGYVIGFLCAFIFKKQWSEIAVLKEEVAQLKISQAVSNSRIDDLKEDIKDLTKIVREVESNISKEIKSLSQDILFNIRK